MLHDFIVDFYIDKSESIRNMKKSINQIYNKVKPCYQVSSIMFSIDHIRTRQTFFTEYSQITYHLIDSKNNNVVVT